MSAGKASVFGDAVRLALPDVGVGQRASTQEPRHRRHGGAKTRPGLEVVPKASTRVCFLSGLASGSGGRGAAGGIAFESQGCATRSGSKRKLPAPPAQVSHGAPTLLEQGHRAPFGAFKLPAFVPVRLQVVALRVSVLTDPRGPNRDHSSASHGRQPARPDEKTRRAPSRRAGRAPPPPRQAAPLDSPSPSAPHPRPSFHSRVLVNPKLMAVWVAVLVFRPYGNARPPPL